LTLTNIKEKNMVSW